MERESFESEDTAAIMNQHFINVKVDREERPDVDRVYVGAQNPVGHPGLNIISGCISCGWQASSVLAAGGAGHSIGQCVQSSSCMVSGHTAVIAVPA